MLPQGMLKPSPDYGENRLQMSADEAMSFIPIYEKPEQEWTRCERRFMYEMFARKPKKLISMLILRISPTTPTKYYNSEPMKSRR